MQHKFTKVNSQESIPSEELERRLNIINEFVEKTKDASENISTLQEKLGVETHEHQELQERLENLSKKIHSMRVKQENVKDLTDEFLELASAFFRFKIKVANLLKNLRDEKIANIKPYLRLVFGTTDTSPNSFENVLSTYKKSVHAYSGFKSIEVPKNTFRDKLSTFISAKIVDLPTWLAVKKVFAEDDVANTIGQNIAVEIIGNLKVFYSESPNSVATLQSLSENVAKLQPATLQSIDRITSENNKPLLPILMAAELLPYLETKKGEWQAEKNSTLTYMYEMLGLERTSKKKYRAALKLFNAVTEQANPFAHESHDSDSKNKEKIIFDQEDSDSKNKEKIIFDQEDMEAFGEGRLGRIIKRYEGTSVEPKAGEQINLISRSSRSGPTA